MAGHKQCRLLNEAEKISGSTPDDPNGKAMTSLNKATLAYRKNDIVKARSLLSEARSTFADAKIDPAIWLEQELERTSR